MFDSDVCARRTRGPLPMLLLALSARGSAFTQAPTRSARLRRLRRALATMLVCAMLSTAWASSLLPPATNGVIAFDGLTFLNPDGSQMTQWPLWAGISGTSPNWSPDGKKIVFENATDECICIYAANADGSGLQQLSTGSDEDGYYHRWPAWSPDGSKIVYSAFGGGELHVMNADGTNPVNLQVQGERPSWSPDGSKILYNSWGHGITTVNPDGTNPTQLNIGVINPLDPTWSPDGTKIAFAAYDWLDSQGVYVANADGSNATRLTTGALDRWPAWSPDGTKTLFSRSLYYTNSTSLWVMNADGSDQTSLTDIGDGNASWQPIPTAPPAFPFAGFFSPLGPAGTLNIAKAGSAVPIKFSLGGNRGLDILAAGSPSTQPIACASADATSTATATGSAGSSGLSYNALSDLYTYVMKTDKAWTNTCRRLTVTLTDGTSHTADFRFN